MLKCHFIQQANIREQQCLPYILAENTFSVFTPVSITETQIAIVINGIAVHEKWYWQRIVLRAPSLTTTACLSFINGVFWGGESHGRYY